VAPTARLISANLLHGISLADGEVHLDRIVSELRDLSPDVLGIQEVDANLARSGFANQTGALVAAVADDAHWRFVPAILGEPGGSWTPANNDDLAGHDLVPLDRASYGVGLIVRWPVRSWHVIRVTPFRFRTPVFIPGLKKWIWIDDEPRVCVAAVCEAPWGLTTIATTHLSFVPGWNVRQLRHVCKALALLPGPRILLGDLNLPSSLPKLVSRWQPLAESLRTFPGPAPRMQLDHVLLHPGNESLRATSAVAHSLSFSDHRIVAVEVESVGDTRSNKK
jgi:endonuclease/exonuclease/phosphatase family metal-dependent hydrolase